MQSFAGSRLPVLDVLNTVIRRVGHARVRYSEVYLYFDLKIYVQVSESKL